LVGEYWYDHIASDLSDTTGEDYSEIERRLKALSNDEILKQYSDHKYFEWEGPWDSDYGLRGRNYDWFAILANVRNYDNMLDTIAEPKGLPDNCSSETNSISERWGPDGHSHSWLTLKELIDFDMNKTEVETVKFGVESYKEWIECGKDPSVFINTHYIRNHHVEVDEGTLAKMVYGIYGEHKPIDGIYYTSVTYDKSYNDFTSGMYKRVVDELTKYGIPEEVRIVFWFDN